MKATASQDGHDTSADPGTPAKRRFRFARKGMEDDLRQLDDIAAQVDRLADEAPETIEAPLSLSGHDVRRDDEVSDAALAALDQLNERLRSASEAAAAGGTMSAPTAEPILTWAQPTPALQAQPAPETAPVNTSTYSQSPAASNADAVALPQPAPTPAPAAAPLAARPQANDAVMVPVDAPRMRTAPAATPQAAPTSHATTSVSSAGYARPTDMLVDVTRILRTLEEEADLARDRIDHEVNNAREEADLLLNSAHADSERVRDHAQQQARVLLSEVEEIISEAQHTGQQILKSADEDADSVRQQAAHTLLQSQEEARRIVEHARREGEQILSEQRRLATVRAQEALREQDRLKDQIRRLEERRAQVLESLGPMIDQLSQMIPADRNVVDFPGSRQ